MSDDIVFEEPPRMATSPASRPTVARHLRPLMDKPGKWARVYGPKSGNAARTWANALRRGRFVGVRQGEYEATARTINGEGYVWARYVGNGVDR